MMKNNIASSIYIPSVFISYTSGEWLLDAMSRAVPWDVLRVTIDSNGERELMKCSRQRIRLFDGIFTNADVFLL